MEASDIWEAEFMRVGDLVLDDLEGLRVGVSDVPLPDDQRAWLLRAIAEMEDDYLELAAQRWSGRGGPRQRAAGG